MPTFCRHNRLVQNCPICAREQAVEMRPVVSPQGRPEARPRPARAATASDRGATRTGSRAGSRSARSMTVRRLAREAIDGYASALVPGIRAIADAERLAEELGFAVTRLQVLATDPPGLYGEVVNGADTLEERTWLAVQVAVLSPLDAPDGGAGSDADPFRSIAHTRTSWASGASPALDDVPLGPRGVADAARAARVCDAYRGWASRLGSQAAGLAGEPSWTPERRFDRAFERLGALAAMEREVRYDLLVTLGRLGVYELRGERLHVVGGDRVTLAAKRILGIGDPLLLQRRAEELAEACELPIEALDLGFFNWERRSRYGAGLDPSLPAEPGAVASARAALGLE
jgi:hypothetical protein